MAAPVEEWNFTYKDTTLYWDLVDKDLLHYGPNRSWSKLIIQKLGEKFTVLKGEIEFGYSVQELDELSNNFKAKRLAPLIANNIANELESRIPLSKPHVASIHLVSSLPFPKLVINITIAMEDPKAADLIVQIEEEWKKRSLLTGRLTFEYSMKSVICAFDLVLTSKEGIELIREKLSGERWPDYAIWEAILSVVDENKDRWIHWKGPSSSPTRGFEMALAFACQAVYKSFFYQTDAFFVFDSGEKISGASLHDPGTLVSEQKWGLTKSQDINSKIYFPT